MGGHEYAASAARVVAETVGGGSASAEAIRILHRNRAADEVATYWVPMITEPNSAGHTLCQPFYDNITRNQEGILMEQDASRTTLAHELGHLLMRAGHCALPDRHGGECACAPADNLMHANGGARSRSPVLTEQQVARLFRVGGANGYVIRSGR